MKRWSRKRRNLMPEFIDELREHLAYNPETGDLTWKVRFGSRVEGPIGVNSKTPYIQVGYNYKIYFAHRLIFALVTGRWADEVDHENKNKRDNRWGNLREVVRAENIINTSVRKHNTTGTTGVYWSKQAQRWMARVSVEGKHISRFFREKDEAIKARKQMEIDYYQGYGS